MPTNVEVLSLRSVGHRVGVGNPLSMGAKAPTVYSPGLPDVELATQHSIGPVVQGTPLGPNWTP